MKPQLKTIDKTTVQLEIENRLLADAMQFLISSSGRRIQVSSLRPGDQLEVVARFREVKKVVIRKIVLQNSRKLRVVEVNSDSQRPDVRSYQQVFICFDTVTTLDKLPFFRRLYARFLVWRANA